MQNRFGHRNLFYLYLVSHEAHAGSRVNLKHRVLILGGCIVLMTAVGCRSAYQMSSESSPEMVRPEFQIKTRVYIGAPPDFIYKEEPVARSGKHTAEALWDAFRLFSRVCVAGRSPETLDQAMEQARKMRSEYLVYPVIIRWEEHRTEWTFIRDRLELRLEVYRVATGRVVYSTEVQARGGMMSDGEDTPEMLLTDPCEKFVRSIYHEVVQPSAFP